MNERIEAIVNDYLDANCILAVAIQKIKSLHQSMQATYYEVSCALTDIGVMSGDATKLLHSWEQELNETVQLA